MAKQKVLKTVTAISNKHGEVVMAGVVIDKDDLEPEIGMRLMDLGAIELVDEDGEGDNSSDVFGSVNNADLAKSAAAAALNRKSRGDLVKMVEDMRKDGLKVDEFADDATKEVIINAIENAKKAE